MKNLKEIILILIYINIINSVKVNITIPEYFKFGAGTAAYQIEGGWNDDGKGPSIWDTLTHNHPEAIDDRSNGDIATNSYKMYDKDIEALKKTNLQFYRFSISWPRILPNGDISSKNQIGIDYYHKLINKLLENNIEPMITMYHWDLPQTLQDLGGAANPLFVNWFEQYANLLFKEYGDKVKIWTTFNEPYVFCENGYSDAIWAPKINSSGVGDYLCHHHIILAHARVYHLYKKNYFTIQKGKIGISLDSDYFYPKDPNNPKDIEAAERALQFNIGIYGHPIFSKTGGYPNVVRQQVDQNSINEGRPWPRLPLMDNEIIEYVKGTSDFYGMNYYTSRIIVPANTEQFMSPSHDRDVCVNKLIDESWLRAKSSWLYSVPDGLYQLLKWIRDEYGNPEVIITENGWSDNGELNDKGRIEYMQCHIYSAIKAIKEGCKVTAYTTWSLIDNFEWAMGYSEKFGIFRVDIDDSNLERKQKDSSQWFRQLIKTRKLEIDENDL